MTNIIFKIKHDLFRYSGKLGFKIFLIHFIKTPGFRFICLHRLCNIYSKFSLIGLLSRFWYKNLQRRYGYQIPLTTKIGKGLFMPHYGNIVFNQAAIIGDNCNIAQGVTIGHISRGQKKGSPVIGDKVWIGANAIIVGKITIGNNALIAPLSFINFDIPENAVVAGNPAKIISYIGSTGYVNRVLK